MVAFSLSGRAARQGPHPHADERRAHHGAARPRGRGIRRRRTRARHHPLKDSRHESTGQGARRTRHLDAGRRRSPRSGTTTCSSRCTAPPSAAPTCISTTGTPGRRRRSRCRWRSATNTPARSSRSAARCAASRSGDRVSGEGHITCGHCRNCRAGRRHLCRNTSGVGVNRPGRVRRISRDPRAPTCSSFPPPSTTRSPRSSIRSATPPTPRSPSISSARTC